MKEDNLAHRAGLKTRFASSDFHDWYLDRITVGPSDILILHIGHPTEEDIKVEITFLECAAIMIQIDVVGGSYTGNAIFSMACEPESPVANEIRGSRKRSYEAGNLEDYAYFHIKLVPPGGELHVFARNFGISRL